MLFLQLYRIDFFELSVVAQEERETFKSVIFFFSHCYDYLEVKVYSDMLIFILYFQKSKQ